MGDVFKVLLRFLVLLLVAVIISLCISLVSWKMSSQFVSKEELKPWDCRGPTSCEPVERFPYDTEMEDAFKQQFPFLVLLPVIVITTMCFCLALWNKKSQTHPDRN